MTNLAQIDEFTPMPGYVLARRDTTGVYSSRLIIPDYIKRGGASPFATVLRSSTDLFSEGDRILVNTHAGRPIRLGDDDLLTILHHSAVLARVHGETGELEMQEAHMRGHDSIPREIKEQTLEED